MKRPDQLSKSSPDSQISKMQYREAQKPDNEGGILHIIIHTG